MATLTGQTVTRPNPPPGLTEAQTEVWADVVLRLPPSWFPKEVHGLLAEYCRATTRAAFIGKEVDAFTPEWLKAPGGLERLSKLTNMLDRQIRAMTSLARSLRITTQSRMRPEMAYRQAAAPGGDLEQPWY